MHTCGSECQISNENKRVDITVTGATGRLWQGLVSSCNLRLPLVISGTMAFAINVIGKYLVPPDWINNPEQAVCTGRGEYVPNHSVPETSGQLTPLDYCSEVPDLSPCSQPFCQSSSCVDASESEQFFKLVIQLDEAVGDISEVQVAMNTGDAWDDYHPMITCTPDLWVLYFTESLSNNSASYISSINFQVLSAGWWPCISLLLHCGHWCGQVCC